MYLKLCRNLAYCLKKCHVFNVWLKNICQKAHLLRSCATETPFKCFIYLAYSHSRFWQFLAEPRHISSRANVFTMWRVLQGILRPLTIRPFIVTDSDNLVLSLEFQLCFKDSTRQSEVSHPGCKCSHWEEICGLVSFRPRSHCLAGTKIKSCYQLFGVLRQASRNTQAHLLV